jgi:hypothetical protein
MGLKNTKRLRALLAAAVLAMIVVPISLAGAKGAESSKASKAAKQIKALKKQTAALAGQLAALQARLNALEGGSQPAAGPRPSGPAGGVLSGSYPDPQLRANSVSSGAIADGAVSGSDLAQNSVSSLNVIDNTLGSADIANETVGLADLGPGSVGGPELTGAFVEKSDPNLIGGGNASGRNVVTCPGNSRLIAGGAEWEEADNDLYITASVPAELNPNKTWEVVGQNNSGSTMALYVKALCLRE